MGENSLNITQRGTSDDMETSNRNSNPLQAQTLGDAHFATPAEVGAAGLVGNKGIRLGYYKAPEDRGKDWGKVIRYGGDAHLITVAPTRSGKGRDVLIPALLEYTGSCIVIDPKGQLAAVTKAHRERPEAEGGLGQEVIVLNPFNLLSQELGPTAQYNPMAALDPEADSFGADCDSLAEAIVVRDGRGESHWPDSARQLISGMIMHLVAHEPPELRNLAAVQKLVSGPTKDLRQFVEDALNADDENGFITARLARFENINDESREALGIISTAITQTGFIGNKAIAKSLSAQRSDFRFRDLKNKATTAYLVLPAKQIETCGKWFRLVVASALADLWSETRGAVPVLAILDEFAQLGHLQVIENAMGLAAGFGLQLWPILQNLTQLKKHYGDNWETFLGGAAIQQFFGPRDEFTADYISKLCGVKTVVTHGQSIQHAEEILQKDRTGASWGQQSQPLLHPHNVRSMGPNECLILGPQNIVIDAFRKPYRQTGEFEGLYSPDPYHKGDASAHNSTFVPKDPPPPADSFATREAAAAHETKRAVAKRRALSIRLLTWGSSDNPILNVLRKIEYVITLPLRLVAALIAAPFAIHNRPLAAFIGFLALFGFWEVFDGLAKGPIVDLYQQKVLEYQYEEKVNSRPTVGNTMNTNYRAAKWLITEPLPRAVSFAVKGSASSHAPGIDAAVQRMSAVIDYYQTQSVRKQQSYVGAWSAGRGIFDGPGPVDPTLAKPSATRTSHEAVASTGDIAAPSAPKSAPPPKAPEPHEPKLADVPGGPDGSLTVQVHAGGVRFAIVPHDVRQNLKNFQLSLTGTTLPVNTILTPVMGGPGNKLHAGIKIPEVGPAYLFINAVTGAYVLVPVADLNDKNKIGPVA